jgi:hypothetical protein
MKKIYCQGTNHNQYLLCKKPEGIGKTYHNRQQKKRVDKGNNALRV